MNYKLKDLVPITDNSVVKIIGSNYHLVEYGKPTKITWRKLLDKARMNFKEKLGSCLIIIEEPMSGTVYSFGNYDLTTIYKQGTTKGYAWHPT